MNKDLPSSTDELQMRAFWTQWNKQMFPAPAVKNAAVAAA
jgi:p-cumate 2,3-dioxygenase alpha subunit